MGSGASKEKKNASQGKGAATATSAQGGNGKAPVNTNRTSLQCADPLADGRAMVAVLKIQSIWRGYRSRERSNEASKAATKIQRMYRRRLSNQQLSETLEKRHEKRENRSRQWKEEGKLKRVDWTEEIKIGEQTEEELNSFQDDIIDVKWFAEQTLEANSIGYSVEKEKELKKCGKLKREDRSQLISRTIRPRILLVSSNVQKAEQLIKHVVKKESHIITIAYDFEKTSFPKLAEKIEKRLNEYKQGSKAESIAFYCQGGPGHAYILKKRVLTPAKLHKPGEEDMEKFFSSIGPLMTKCPAEDAVVYFMGFWLHGNKQGEKLCKSLTELMKPNMVRFEAPLEMSREGAEMLSAYFHVDRYKLWKSQQHLSMEIDWRKVEPDVNIQNGSLK
ncbi:NMDA receptor synaptonuclear signaling and neuronal migration factor [Lingula anatina]|uniref:NMDA receptor synaptonuclear signaling and neuronal migration factor n=1 Tax=Lingula anatina TaxID=7574 RepID=A0A1S3IZH5_LINAN|nr:NMDA receptor synaptonuclear signaling and neuronal migration factor [Lingula anatina]|eukprot:XP_013402954.1 NMDA receptor synaptonuclear signaling and neuronal migration factor [Lingula anatina]